jgi:hypothetical protein
MAYVEELCLAEFCCELGELPLCLRPLLLELATKLLAECLFMA